MYIGTPKDRAPVRLTKFVSERKFKQTCMSFKFSSVPVTEICPFLSVHSPRIDEISKLDNITILKMYD